MIWPEIEECLNRYELKLSGQRIADRLKNESNLLPQALFSLSQLNHLEISEVELVHIEGEDISRLVNLHSLILSNNRLTKFPLDISKLTKLKHLDISNNVITNFDDIKLPASIETLTATQNSIASFQLTQNMLDCLTTIDVSYCKIELFNVENAPLLRHIDLKGNCMKSTPTCFCNLSNLKTLDISENNINDLNAEVILGCTRLKDINAANNPISDGRLRKLLDQHAKTRTIIEYLTSKLAKTSNEKNNKISNKCDTIEERTCSAQLSYTVKQGSISVLQDLETKQSGYHLVCCILRNVDLSTEGKFENIIKEQIRLHNDYFDQRNNATLATHDLDAISIDNLRFRVTSLDEVSITPLGCKNAISADVLYNELRAESERKRKEKKKSRILSLHKYLDIITIKNKVAHLSDSQRTMSLHPLTNCEQTKLSKTTKNVLLEVCSAVSLDTARMAMDVTIEAFVRLGCWPVSSQSIIEQIRVLNQNDKSLKYVYPSRTDLSSLPIVFS